ncbi:hypothetical protein [Pleionea mediterranea]|uniref:Uncharacterized protein n=1 Tax=Pleionea mediterranea TaxID=523701 RepID=A0A316FGY8_9GAMM|nr:hypothetical protein [Pleionea mediterranea]PWK47385.1 hypothetical protein C8D97_111130 [Pleionea mediterranea]
MRNLIVILLIFSQPIFSCEKIAFNKEKEDTLFIGMKNLSKELDIYNCSKKDNPSTFEDASKIIESGLSVEVLEQVKEKGAFNISFKGYTNPFQDLVDYFYNKWKLNDNSELIKKAKEKGLYISKSYFFKVLLEESARRKFGLDSNLSFEVMNARLISEDKKLDHEKIGFPCKKPSFRYNKKQLFESKTGYVRWTYMNKCNIEFVYLFEIGWIPLQSTGFVKK